MISEGTQIEPRGQGYAWTPGIYSDEQIEGWRRVTDAVHAEGGAIFAQLWQCRPACRIPRCSREARRRLRRRRSRHRR
ncbi:hypothetical protein [Paraburkholderia sp. BL6665CI2N2]|uniref:oxidoreductase n=1 Tax=Paraburkholderia sp. BL6665CI2N2 TaxID=1938806 RepID=UPI001FB8D45A|nr:hypothetical protein [Paraburkholderia sp. BL6665CI2N2]